MATERIKLLISPRPAERHQDWGGLPPFGGAHTLFSWNLYKTMYGFGLKVGGAPALPAPPAPPAMSLMWNRQFHSLKLILDGIKAEGTRYSAREISEPKQAKASHCQHL